MAHDWGGIIDYEKAHDRPSLNTTSQYSQSFVQIIFSVNEAAILYSVQPLTRPPSFPVFCPIHRIPFFYNSPFFPLVFCSAVSFSNPISSLPSLFFSVPILFFHVFFLYHIPLNLFFSFSFAFIFLHSFLPPLSVFNPPLFSTSLLNNSFNQPP